MCELQMSNMFLFAVLLLASSRAAPPSQPETRYVPTPPTSTFHHMLPQSAHFLPASPVNASAPRLNPFTEQDDQFEEFSDTQSALSETVNEQNSLKSEFLDPTLLCEPCPCVNNTMQCSAIKIRSFLVSKSNVDVTHLDLSQNSVEELSERVFAMLPNLNDISLSNNHINEISPEAFDGLISIKQIDLSSNTISEIPMETLSKLSTLERFYLSRNRVNDIGFISQIRNCSLQVLQLSANAMTSLPMQAFGRCTNLKEIWIGGNKIYEINEDAFEGLINLITLDLSGNKIEDLSTGTFRFLTRLRSLDLSHNRLTIIDDQLFKYLTSLDSLYLSFNWISFIPPKAFSPCVSLRRLDLSENLINNIDYSAFSSPITTNESLPVNKSIHPKCVNLTSRLSNIPIEYLDLSHNYLQSVPSRTFLALAKLEQLNLEDNLITTFASDFICLVAKLRDGLRFSGNRLVCSCGSLYAAFRFAERIAPDFQPKCVHTEESWVILKARQCEVPKPTLQARSTLHEPPPPQPPSEDYSLDSVDEPQQSSIRTTVLASILAVAFLAAMAAFTAEVVKYYRRGKYDVPAREDIQMTQYSRTTSIRVNENNPDSVEEVTAMIVKNTPNEVPGGKESEKSDISQTRQETSDVNEETSKL